ncbi:hypothetical protein Tco_0408945 [Tanacetum coccineum]
MSMSVRKSQYGSSKIDKQVNEVVKEAGHNALQAPLCERFRDLSEIQMKEILLDRIFESNFYRSHLEHAALYEAFEASMQREINDELHAELTNLQFRSPQVVHDIDKPLPLGGPPGQVTIQTQYFFNKDLEYVVSGNKERRHALSISKLKGAYYPDFGLEELVPSLWTESKSDYDISLAYGISHCHITHKDSQCCQSQDLLQIRLHILKEFVLRKADYQEYKISEANFKNIHLNDFEEIYLLHIQGKINHLSGVDKVALSIVVNLWTRNIVIRQRVEDLQLDIESYQTKLNLTQPRWDATNFLFKEDYINVYKPRVVIYRDRKDQKNIMWETKVYKFSDVTLTRILEKLDYMV